jgi:hypothetical protein
VWWWVLLWFLLFVAAGLFLGWLGLRLFRQGKELTAELATVNDRLLAVSEALQELDAVTAPEPHRVSPKVSRRPRG